MIKSKPRRKPYYTLGSIALSTAIWMAMTMFAYYYIFEATA